MSRPRILDLYCGEGGASAGYVAAGFDVVGVDLHPKPRYPYEFHQGDALAFLADPWFMAGFDVVHASPPCKSENPLRHLRPDIDHPDLLSPTLAMLREQPVPWVVENVSASRKMPGALILCGAAFGLGALDDNGDYRALRRHRLFASSVFLMGGGCACSGGPKIGVYGHGSGRPTAAKPRSYQANKAEAIQALGIDWMSRDGLSQSIPPAYTEFIGEQLIDALDLRGASCGRGATTGGAQ